MAAAELVLEGFQSGDNEKVKAGFAPEAIITQWLGPKPPRSVTVAQMCKGLDQARGPNGLPVYTNVRRFCGPGSVVEQHTVTFPTGNEFMRPRRIEAVLIFELGADGKCVRMDEFLHAKEGVMMLTTEQHTRPPRTSKL